VSTTVTHHPGLEPQKVHQSLQAEVWESEAEIMLDRIGVEPGWKCLDLACGPTGILSILARRVGAEGLVLGIDRGEPWRRSQRRARVRPASIRCTS